MKLDQIAVPADGDLTLQVELKLAEGLHLNPDVPMTYLVETLPDAKTPWFVANKKAEPKTSFQVTIPAAKLAGSSGLRFSLLYFECSEGKSAICRIKSQIWDVPLTFDKDAKSRLVRLEGPSAAKK